MLKSIVKEIIIVLLLVVIILLLLGVFLYDYIPTNKVVPKTEQYQVPNAIKEELEQSVNDLEESQKTQIVYEIDGTDLKNYEKSKDYQKGKVNPFAAISSDPGSSSNGTDTNTGDTNTNASTNQNSNSVGNYLPNTGTK